MTAIDTPERPSRVSRIWILIVVQAVIMLAMLMFGDVKYEVSDDFVMQLISSGVSSAEEADSHLIFSSYLWGSMLRFLYRSLSQVNWYLWCQIAVGFLSCCGVACIMGKRMSLFCGAVCTCVFALFLKDLYILPQFTKTAAAAIASGGALFLEELTDGRTRSRLRVALALVLIFSGCLIRHNAMYVALANLLLLACFLVERILRKRRRREIITYGLICALLVAAVFWLRYVDRQSYFTKDAYGNFLNYSYTRALIVDYPCPTYEECRGEFEKIGLSPVDYDLILNWSFADKQVFSLSKMQKVLAIVNQHRPKPYPTLLSVILHLGGRGIYKYPGTIVCLLFSGAILAGHAIRKRKDGGVYAESLWSSCWIPLVAGVIALVEMGVLVYQGHCVYRVEYGFLFSAAVLLLFPLSETCKKRVLEVKGVKVFMGGFCALLLALLAWRLTPDTAYQTLSDEAYRGYINGTFDYSWDYDAKKYSRTVNRRQMSGAFLQEAATHKSNLYLLDFNTTIQSLYYNFSPLVPVPEGTFSNLIYLGGVTVNHPWLDGQLEKWGLSDPLRGLLEDHVYLVSNNTAELVLEWLRMHCDPDTTMALYREADGYKIWSFSRGDS